MHRDTNEGNIWMVHQCNSIGNCVLAFVYRWQAAFGGKVEYTEDTKPGLDFIGMNYYGR